MSGLGHGLIWPALLLLFCGWIITLGGLAALQNSCDDEDYINIERISILGVPPADCSKAFRWLWFIWAFEFVAFIGIAITAALKYAHPGPWLAWGPLLAIATVLQMIATNIAFNLFDGIGSRGSFDTRAKVAFAGFLITSVANCLLLLAIGMAVHSSYDSGHKKDDDGGYVERRTAYVDPVPVETTGARRTEAHTESAGVAHVV